MPSFRAIFLIVICGASLTNSVIGQPRKPVKTSPKRQVVSVDPVIRDGSLFVRLGGKKQVNVLVRDWLRLVESDPRINLYFKNTPMRALTEKMTNKICQMTGGGCVYKGLDMRRAHLPGVIKRASGGQKSSIGIVEFNAMIENLTSALDKNKIPAQEKTELIGLMGQIKGEIMGLSAVNR